MDKKLKKMKIKEFAEVVTGGTPSTKKKEYWENGNIPWLPSGACKDKVIRGADNFITSLGLENSSAKMMPKGTVVIALTGATTGKLGILGFEACANQSVTGIIPNDKFISQYIFYYLKFIREKILFDSYGGAQKHISQGYIKEIEVPLPDIDVQRNIVYILEKSQKLIDKRKEQIEELDLLVKSKFIEMFGNPITNSKGWNIKLLGEVCEMKAGKNIKSADIYEKNNGKLYPCYGGNGLRGYVRDYSHDGNIPLIGRQGALCGNVKYAKGKFYATEHAVVTNPKIEMNTYWLYYILEQLDLNRLSTGAAQPGLTVGKLKEVELPIAPIGMQNDFENFAKQVDKLKFEMKKSLKELEENFNSLMQKIFKVDLL
ncbi:restriction endonuclease subunit S [Clostridium perfringens]